MTIFALEPRTVTLSSPAYIDGREIRQIVLRPPSMAKLRAAIATAPTAPADQAVAMISVLTDLPPGALLELTVDDLLTLTEAAEQMIALPAKTTIPRAGKRRRKLRR